MRRILALTAFAVVLAAACTSDEPKEMVIPDPPAGGTVASLGSCAQLLSAETLPQREFVFDGTVLEIEEASQSHGPSAEEAAPPPYDTATFQVNEWFKGGPGDEITLKGVGLASSMFVAEDTPSANIGDRFLVSGDEDFAFTCGGFTQPYDVDVAAEWKGYLEG